MPILSQRQNHQYHQCFLYHSLTHTRRMPLAMLDTSHLSHKGEGLHRTYKHTKINLKIKCKCSHVVDKDGPFLWGWRSSLLLLPRARGLQLELIYQLLPLKLHQRGIDVLAEGRRTRGGNSMLLVSITLVAIGVSADPTNKTFSLVMFTSLSHN